MQHEVEQGECMASIGAANGYNWQTLWTHPQNATISAKTPMCCSQATLYSFRIRHSGRKTAPRITRISSS